MDFGTKLRQLREKQRLSQREVAEMVQVVQSSYCDWENGNCFPKINYLPLLAEALDVEIEVLLADIMKMNQSAKSD